jgi:phosphatidylglycerol:prolipoprotein diacylglycerol transferase
MFPEILHLGNFFLPTYGVLVTTGFLLGLWMVARFSRRAGINPDSAVNLGIYVAIAGMAGAKLLMVLMDLNYYTQNPGEIFSIYTLRAGGIFYGGLILALIVAVVYMRRQKLPGLATADVFAPGIALGHGVGRLGCFAAGCCWGAVSHAPWAVTFTNPEAHKLVGVPLDIPLQPTQLYEAFAEFAIFAILYRRIGRPHRPGAIIGLYLAMYSTVRFLVEFVRAHDQANPYFGPFVAEQWIALGLLAIGIWLLTRRPAAVPAPDRAVKA